MSPLKLNGSTSGFVALDAPAAAGSNTLVLPTGNGSNGQVLTTNGSGSLSWSTIAASQWTTSGSNIYYTTGSVGIGITSPGSALNLGDTSAESGIQLGDGADFTIKRNVASLGVQFNVGADLNNYQFHIGGTERIRIDSSGRLLLNTTSTSGFVTDGGRFYIRNSGECMAIYNDTGSGWNVRHNATSNGGTFYYISFAAAGTGVGSITSSSTTTTYATSSDYRLKENIEPIAGAVDRLKELNPCRFNFIAAPERTVDGFIAHEVQEHVPEAIVGAKDAVDEKGEPVYQGIDQSKLVPLLTAALQEAIGRIEALEANNAALEARLSALEVTP